MSYNTRVCDFYQRSNSIISHFSLCNTEPLYSFRNTLCIHNNTSLLCMCVNSGF